MENNQFNKPTNNKSEKSTTSAAGKEGFAHKVGDQIERVGQKISSTGAEKIGKAVHTMGDKIEHLGEKKKK